MRSPSEKGPKKKKKRRERKKTTSYLVTIMKSTAHFPQLAQGQQPKPNLVFEVPVTVTLPKIGTFLLSLTRYTSGSFNRNRHNQNRRISLKESPCLEVMNLVLVSLSPRILNRQHAHKQTKELGHDGNGQSTFSGSSRAYIISGVSFTTYIISGL